MVITSTTGNRVAANTARGFESLLLRQLVASDISLATSFFISLQNSSRRALILLLLASKSDPLTLGSGLGPPLRGGLSAHKEISILTVPSKSEQVIHRLLRFIFVSQSALALRRLRSRPRGRSGEGDAAGSREGAGVGPPSDSPQAHAAGGAFSIAP